jgi:glycosyltransferase involved in cell wall biosynthesis
MRIAIIATDIPDYSIEFAEMVALRQPIYLFCPEDFVASDWIEENKNITVCRYVRRRHRDPRNLIWVFRLAYLIKRSKVDIVHVLSEKQVWLNLLGMMLPGVPLVTTVHDVTLHPGDQESGRVPRFFVDRFIRRSAAIIVHGDTLRDLAHKIFDIGLDQIFIIPHLPLLRYIKIATENCFQKPKDGKFRILFFGRIYSYKGLRFLIDAAPSIKEQIPNASFIVAGRGDDLTPYLARIQNRTWFDIRNRFVPPLEASRLFAEADLVVLPYTEASESGVLSIAVAFATPVVATNVGEMGVTVKQNGLGEIVPPADPDALAAAIIKLYKSHHMRSAVSKNCDKTIQGKWSRRILGEKVMGIYEGVMSRPGR